MAALLAVSEGCRDQLRPLGSKITAKCLRQVVRQRRIVVDHVYQGGGREDSVVLPPETVVCARWPLKTGSAEANESSLLPAREPQVGRS